MKPRLSQKLVDFWVEQLRNPGYAPAELRFLTNTRGFSQQTLDRFEIGWDDHRITIPVRDRSGALVNCKRYQRKPKVGEPKSLHLKGWGSPARLAFLDHLPAEPDEGQWLLVCGGEWDALAALQHGFFAVSPTSGEGNLPRPADLAALTAWRVALCLDDDDAGHKAANKWMRELLLIAAVVKNVRLGVKDVNDWFVEGRSALDLSELIEATPEAGLQERRPSDQLLSPDPPHDLDVGRPARRANALLPGTIDLVEGPKSNG